MSRWRVLASVAGLAAASGCAVDFGKVDMSKIVATPSGAEKAEAAVFDLYRQHGMAAMPTLFYYGGAALDCEDGGFMWNGICSDGATVSGETIILSDCGADGIGMQVSEMCWVSYGDDPALLHEMGHALSLQTDGDGCGDHNCPTFKPGGVVEQATNRLIELGM